MKSLLAYLVSFVMVTSLFAQTDGDKNPILTDKFIIAAGLYFPSENVDLGVQGTTDLGMEDFEDIDFDETLGLSGGKTTFNLHFMWRFSKSKKWSMSGEFFRLNTVETVTLEEEIEWEDVVYPVGGEAKLGYGLSLYRVFFGRVISTGQKHELGGGLGIHGLNTNAFIEGNATIDGEEAGFERREEKIFLPLPNIGAWYTWAPTTRWSFIARVDWFGIKIDNISGGLWNISPGLSYRIWKNIGVNANYQFLNFNADIDQDDWKGSFDLTFGGPSFRVFAHF